MNPGLVKVKDLQEAVKEAQDKTFYPSAGTGTLVQNYPVTQVSWYDAFAQWNRTGGKPPSDWSRAEVQACENVAAAVRNASSRGAGKSAAWDAAWRDVYALADAVCERVADQDARRAKL